MFLRRCRHQISNGGGLFLFKSLVSYSTNAKVVPPQNTVLADYLFNSLGLSKEAAISASNKVSLKKPMKKEPHLVVNYLENLGMTKTQVRTIVSSIPRILCYDVDKTLVPKIKVLQELGLSGVDIVKVLMAHKTLLSRGLNGFIRPRIEYFRKLFCTDERVIAACKRYALRTYKLEIVKRNILFLQNAGFTGHSIVELIVKDPKNILFSSAEKLQDILCRVENYLGIPRESGNYHYGICVLISYSQSNIDGKLEIFKSFGWSDVDIREMLRMKPLILSVSAVRMRRGLDYFMRELGYSTGYLAAHPVLLSLNLEKRVKPRNEVRKILSEKKLTNVTLYTVSVMTEAKFVKQYILPYKDLLPEMSAEYFKKIGKKKMKR